MAAFELLWLLGMKGLIGLRLTVRLSSREVQSSQRVHSWLRPLSQKKSMACSHCSTENADLQEEQLFTAIRH